MPAKEVPELGRPLPRAQEAVVDGEDKLRNYALSPMHPKGRHKARVFRATLGLTRDDWEYLRDTILSGLPAAPVTKITPGPFVTYEVTIDVMVPDGRSMPIVTAWELPRGRPPRLVTAYVAQPRGSGK